MGSFNWQVSEQMSLAHMPDTKSSKWKWGTSARWNFRIWPGVLSQSPVDRQTSPPPRLLYVGAIVNSCCSLSTSPSFTPSDCNFRWLYSKPPWTVGSVIYSNAEAMLSNLFLHLWLLLACRVNRPSRWAPKVDCPRLRWHERQMVDRKRGDCAVSR